MKYGEYVWLLKALQDINHDSQGKYDGISACGIIVKPRLFLRAKIHFSSIDGKDQCLDNDMTPIDDNIYKLVLLPVCN